MGWHHAAGGSQERERVRRGCPARPVVARGRRVRGVARPCHVAGPNRGGGEADWWGPSTVEGGRARRGPVGQWLGCERERDREARRRWGADMRVRAAQCRVARFKLDLNRFKI
jgi:hypothetical protein